MAEFMVISLSSEAADDALSPGETKALVEGHSAFERKCRAAGVYKDGERFRPSSEGRRVRVRDETSIVDVGPFEAPTVDGFHVIVADTLEAAVALAADCPVAPGGQLDVRPIMGGRHDAGKSKLQGRVFGFGVLGRADDEPAWTRIMDRIDAGTGDAFEKQKLAGGVRLHAPGRGRRVVASGANRTVFDGAFLESKEIIGGLVFKRLRTIEEAVRWASGTFFAKLGAVEIRELWRS